MGHQEGTQHKGVSGIHPDRQKDQLRKIIISVDLPGTNTDIGTDVEDRQKLIDGD